MKIPLLILFVVLLSSCKHRSVEEEVISYFEQQRNPEKLQAARYLLNNMKGHYSLSGPNYSKYVKVLHEVSGYVENKRKNAITDLMKVHAVGDTFSMEKDDNTITAKYLIDHIENIYRVWEKVPWRKDYSFDLFCEYVLPYRIENERYSNWVRPFNEAFSGLFKEVFFEGGTVYKAVDHCKDTIQYLSMLDSDSTTMVKLEPGKNSVIFDHIKIDKAGEKWIRIQYTSGQDSADVMMVFNKKDTVVHSLSPSGNLYCYPNNQWRIRKTFEEGDNTIEISVRNQPIGLDYISIIPIEDFHRNGLTDGGHYMITNVGNGQKLAGKKVLNMQNIDYGFFVLRDSLQALGLRWNPYYSQDTSKLEAFTGKNNQQWFISAVDTGYYKIISKINGKCLEFSLDGHLTASREYKGLPSQQWHFKQVGTGTKFDPKTHVPQNTPLEYACRVKDAINFQWMFFGNYFPALPADEILKIHTGDCREQSHYLVYILRSLGIPAVSEVNPQRPYKDMGHDFNAIIGSKGETIYYQLDTKPGTGKPDSPIAKIYRRTFETEPTSLALNKYPHEIIPPEFDNPYMKDVTKEYFNTRTISVPVFQQADGQHVYLCVWDDAKWLPVGWGEIRDRKATFKDVGLNALYMPMIFDKQYTAIGKPFVVKDSSITYISVNPEMKQQAVLTRKYWWPANHFMDYRLKGGKFQGANKEDFSDAVTFYTIKEKIKPVYYNIRVSDQKMYKYYRFWSAPYNYGNLGEMKFYGKDDHELQGKVIGNEGSYKSLGNGRENVFDNNILTYYDGKSRLESWVGIALNTPQALGRIRFVPRSDGNCVETGDSYELLYWDNKEWTSLGEVVAQQDSLVYSNLPKGALFLLKDKTKGKQQRVFTLDERGRQVMW